ncbi:MAG: DUF3006 domain-containing protein [Bacilli bacterium]|nr:DUF3006 domain-containing protein [Bacilli bacterium]
MKYVIDRIENDIAILEGLETRKIINVSLSKLPKNVLESDVLNFENGKYVLDEKTKLERLEIIRRKMDKLRK